MAAPPRKGGAFFVLYKATFAAYYGKGWRI